MEAVYNNVENRKDWIINELISLDIYKMSDGRHLYEVPLDDLEEAYHGIRRKVSNC
ncbi:Fur-regulated basic protein FbpA [Bacillus taeanensis]|uniref:Fur-regulated basic protein FbpA n=1 Tax=Bacillus taeanensis TaxID=273032 RepID=A0A366XY23_9BACI|nr:Fur-regulated basic protein FbpA [Bacillus taeanensis]RBW69054.1 Fur-regulated basic protein FbpA [Bacillus taeanensis]